MRGGFADRKDIPGRIGEKVIIDDDPAIDRDTGGGRDPRIRLDADGDDNHFRRNAAAVFELDRLDPPIAEEPSRRGFSSTSMPVVSIARLSIAAARASSWRSIRRSMR